MRVIFLLVVFLLAQASFIAGCGGSSQGSTQEPPSGNPPPPADPPPEDPPPEDPPPVGGLDERPSNSTCIAPDRPTSEFGVALERVFPSLDFQGALYMLQAPGDDSRWFVLQKSGRVRVFENESGVSAAGTFLDLSGVVNDSSEGGLLGLAFNPDFATTGIAYLSYTRTPPGGTGMESVISRFVSVDGGLTLDPASERVLLTIAQPYSNHNGGGMKFGPDGYLYIGLGDGGASGDPQNNAQNTHNLLGAMLRIDVSGGGDYGIPDDNPFAGNSRCLTGQGAEPCPELFAWGLRNPWRFSFDRATGQLWAGDVGQGAREEIDIIELGGNYGWRYREGFNCFSPSTDCPTAGLTDPVLDYSHAEGGSVTGGYVYRGDDLPGLQGRYVFGDFTNGRIWTTDPDQDGAYHKVEIIASGLSVSSFGEGHDGELYVVDISGGGLYAFRPGADGGSDTIPALLSETGCMDDTDPALPGPALIPYSPAAPFWSDGATKERWLALPDGTSISVTADGNFGFPVGSVLVKHFRIGDRLVETRMFMRHTDGGWAGYTYRWNAAQTDATRVVGGATVDLGSGSWLYPSEAECMRCHTSAAGRALGLEIAQLNNVLAYPQTGREANQLVTLDALGMLSPPLAADPEDLATLPDPFGDAPLASRARAYLHTNCAGCHRPGGPTPSDMDWRYDVSLTGTSSCDVPPVTGSDLGVNEARLLSPGDPARSLVWLRMSVRDAHAMPPIGSLAVDPDGLTLVGDWIAGLQGCE